MDGSGRDRGGGSARSLDDEDDREELRRRYYGLMQELRVVLPGVQVLVAFLLTVPFNQRFADLGPGQKALYGVALAAAVLSVVAFVTPTAGHRVGERTARVERLELAIRMSKVGLVCLAVALLAAVALVAGFVFSAAVAVAAVACLAVAIVVAWVVLPLRLRRHGRDRSA